MHPSFRTQLNPGDIVILPIPTWGYAADYDAQVMRYDTRFRAGTVLLVVGPDQLWPSEAGTLRVIRVIAPDTGARCWISSAVALAGVA